VLLYIIVVLPGTSIFEWDLALLFWYSRPIRLPRVGFATLPALWVELRMKIWLGVCCTQYSPSIRLSGTEASYMATAQTGGIWLSFRELSMHFVATIWISVVPAVLGLLELFCSHLLVIVISTLILCRCNRTNFKSRGWRCASHLLALPHWCVIV
jgi:hypothetical protein